jgi:hypothetical protein
MDLIDQIYVEYIGEQVDVAESTIIGACEVAAQAMKTSCVVYVSDDSVVLKRVMERLTDYTVSICVARCEKSKGCRSSWFGLRRAICVCKPNGVRVMWG